MESLHSNSAYTLRIPVMTSLAEMKLNRRVELPTTLSFFCPLKILCWQLLQASKELSKMPSKTRIPTASLASISKRSSPRLAGVEATPAAAHYKIRPRKKQQEPPQEATPKTLKKKKKNKKKKKTATPKLNSAETPERDASPPVSSLCESPELAQVPGLPFCSQSTSLQVEPVPVPQSAPLVTRRRTSKKAAPRPMAIPLRSSSRLVGAPPSVPYSFRSRDKSSQRFVLILACIIYLVSHVMAESS